MKCREALKHLYDFLDKQLDDNTVDHIQEHLKNCKHCFDTYTFEENLNNFIKEKSTANFDETVDKLKANVLTQIQKIDSASNPQPDQKEDNSGFFLFRRPVIGVTAFALVAVVALFLFLKTSNSVTRAEVFDPFIQNHQLAIAGQLPMDIATNDPYMIDSCLSAKMILPKKLFMADSLCNPTMAKIDYNLDKQFAQIVYNVDGNNVSIFCIKKSDYAFPQDSLVQLEDMPNAYTYQFDSQNLLLWQCPVYWYVAVSSLDSGLIKDFVSQLN